MVTEEIIKCYRTLKVRMPHCKEQDFDRYTWAVHKNGFTNVLMAREKKKDKV